MVVFNKMASILVAKGKDCCTSSAIIGTTAIVINQAAGQGLQKMQQIKVACTIKDY